MKSISLFLLASSLILLLGGCCDIHPGTRVEQSVRTNPDSPSCGFFCTYVWYKGDIARCWYDNTCGLTDSIIQVRKQDAEYLLKILKHSK